MSKGLASINITKDLWNRLRHKKIGKFKSYNAMLQKFLEVYERREKYLQEKNKQ